MYQKGQKEYVGFLPPPPLIYATRELAPCPHCDKGVNKKSVEKHRLQYRKSNEEINEFRYILSNNL
jgi:hypothetical protein